MVNYSHVAIHFSLWFATSVNAWYILLEHEIMIGRVWLMVAEAAFCSAFICNSLRWGL
jgi:hypothetical protein